MFKFLKAWVARKKKACVTKEYDQYAQQNSETRAVIHTKRNALDILILELGKKKAGSNG